jgi:hypothetical protein
MPRVASLAAYGVAIALGLGAPSDNAAAQSLAGKQFA